MAVSWKPQGRYGFGLMREGLQRKEFEGWNFQPSFTGG